MVRVDQWKKTHKEENKAVVRLRAAELLKALSAAAPLSPLSAPPAIHSCTIPEVRPPVAQSNPGRKVNLFSDNV